MCASRRSGPRGFRALDSSVQSSDMWLLDRSDRRTAGRATSDLLKRVQRLEREHAELRARLQGERQLRILAAQIVGAAQAAPVIGAAIERFSEAVRRPLPRGCSGGLVRARQASELRERWSDGRYMAHEDCERIEREVCEGHDMRYAPGGFARAASAVRAPAGRYLPK